MNSIKTLWNPSWGTFVPLTGYPAFAAYMIWLIVFQTIVVRFLPTESWRRLAIGAIGFMQGILVARYVLWPKVD